MENLALSPFMSDVLKKNEKQSSVHGHSLEWLEGCLDMLTKFLSLQLSDQERVLWMEQLSKYPKWKLLEIDNYRLNDNGSGRTLAHVCKYLDELRPAPERETVREDLGYKKLPYNPNKELGREVLAYCKDMMIGGYTKAQLDEKELTFIHAMRKKHPQVNWQCGRSANNGK